MTRQAEHVNNLITTLWPGKQELDFSKGPTAFLNGNPDLDTVGSIELANLMCVQASFSFNFLNCTI